MGRIKNTEIMVNDIIGEIAAESWYEAQDTLENLKQEARELAYATVEEQLDSDEIDVDDWEAVIGEDLETYIDEIIDAEWDI